MSITVTCPKCENEFKPPEALIQSIRENLRSELDKEWAELEEQKVALESEPSVQLTKIEAAYENKLMLLEKRYKERETEYKLKIKETEKKFDDQLQRAGDMVRKGEQGSMQLQGEVQELELEKQLRELFPSDTLKEVPKGVSGADCLLTVRNSYGHECGKVLFESKRTQSFNEKWIEKLKEDSLAAKADVAVLVTKAMPKGMQESGMRDGVLICTLADVRPLVHVLRDGVINVYAARRSQEKKDDKVDMLYNYMISNDFTQQWNAIREGIKKMQASILHERCEMEKLWAERDKQLTKVLVNAARIRGAVDGIADIGVDLDLTGAPASLPSASQASTSRQTDRNGQNGPRQAKKRKTAIAK